MNSFTSVAISFVLLFFITLESKADLVFSHSGNTNPVSEGWSLLNSGGGATSGSVSNDLGSGINAWFTDDDGTAGNSIEIFSQIPTSTQVSDANALGWTLRANLRVVDIPDSVDFSVFSGYRDGTNEWAMLFGSEPDGDPVVKLSTGPNVGPEFTLDGTGGGYHLFELIFDPDMGTADLFVDGIERISDYGGRSDGLSALVEFGAGESLTTGRGHWNSVQWRIHSIPEPSSLAMCGIGMFFLGVRRARSRGN